MIKKEKIIESYIFFKKLKYFVYDFILIFESRIH